MILCGVVRFYHRHWGCDEDLKDFHGHSYLNEKHDNMSHCCFCFPSVVDFKNRSSICQTPRSPSSLQNGSRTWISSILTYTVMAGEVARHGFKTTYLQSVSTCWWITSDQIIERLPDVHEIQTNSCIVLPPVTICWGCGQGKNLRAWSKQGIARPSKIAKDNPEFNCVLWLPS